MPSKRQNFHIGIIIFLFLLLSLSHYHELLVATPYVGKICITCFLGSSEYTVERFFYLLLLIYAAWTLATKKSGAIWVVSAIAMLPQAIFVSPNVLQALVESTVVLVAGAFNILFVETRKRLNREQKKVNGIAAALKTSRKNYKELFENASDAIWVHDLDGKITIANKACEKLTGYSNRESTSMNVSEFLSPEALLLARAVRTRLLEGSGIHQRYEQRIIRKDKTEAIVELATRLISIDDKPSAFQNIARDVTEERMLRDNLRIQIQKTLVAQEEERKRIAREIHDDIAQSVLLLSRRLDILISGTKRKILQNMVRELEELYHLADEIYRSVQRYARDLRPSILDQMGLVAALNWSADKISKELGVRAEVKTSALPKLSPEIELVMFRIAQEALNNIRKHAEASEVSITLESAADNIKMIITDNGKGFAMSRLSEGLAKEGKLGVLGMEERARLIGGTVEIKPEPGKGTTIIVEAPA